MRIYYNFNLLLMLSLLVLDGCKFTSSYPDAKLTVKVVDEHGQPVKDAEVGIGFENGYYNDQPKVIYKTGLSDSSGYFVAKSTTSNYVSYGAVKNGYYRTTNEYSYIQKKSGRWEPWNPEVTVVLRKIEVPVPMYARRAKLQLPVLNKEVGFDLLKYDWVAPHGNGTRSDIYFKGTRTWISELEFDGTLTIRFPNANDGIQLVKENKLYGSAFKLPRYAPIDGYQRQMQKKIKAFPGRGFDYDYSEDNNYIFRTRSEYNNGNFSKAMYGKLHGDIGFGLKGTTTASINFIYYINPEYTNNLEFDPKRNLFSNLKFIESVTLP